MQRKGLCGCLCAAGERFGDEEPAGKTAYHPKWNCHPRGKYQIGDGLCARPFEMVNGCFQVSFKVRQVDPRSAAGLGDGAPSDRPATCLACTGKGPRKSSRQNRDRQSCPAHPPSSCWSFQVNCTCAPCIARRYRACGPWIMRDQLQCHRPPVVAGTPFIPTAGPPTPARPDCSAESFSERGRRRPLERQGEALPRTMAHALTASPACRPCGRDCPCREAGRRPGRLRPPSRGAGARTR